MKEISSDCFASPPYAAFRQRRHRPDGERHEADLPLITWLPIGWSGHTADESRAASDGFSNRISPLNLRSPTRDCIQAREINGSESNVAILVLDERAPQPACGSCGVDGVLPFRPRHFGWPSTFRVGALCALSRGLVRRTETSHLHSVRKQPLHDRAGTRSALRQS